MIKNSHAASTFVLALLLAGLAADAIPLTPAAAASSSSCDNQTDPFSVNGATWGTTGSPASAYPGEQDVPLTVTLLFSGPCTSPQTTFYLGLTQGPNQVPFIGLNGVQEPSIVALDISPNTIVTETFYLNIDQNALTNLTYYVPLIIQYSNNTLSSQVTQTSKPGGGQLVAPIALYGQVQLAFSANTARLQGGSTTNVTVTMTNSGAGAAGPVSTTVTVPQGVTLLNQFAVSPALAPGANFTQVLQLFVPSSLTGTAFVLTLTSKYLDPYSNVQTSTLTLGFTVVSSSGSLSSTSFVVTAASWGAATSSSPPLPGAQDTALVVSLQYLGSEPVDSLQGSLQLPTGFTDLDARQTAIAYSSATTNQYGEISLTFYLDLANTVAPGNHNFTLALDWMTSQASGLVQTVAVTLPPVAQLDSSFQVQSASWGASGSPASPAPGVESEPLVVTLQYLGTTSVSNIEGALTLPAGFTGLDGGQTETAYSATASPNQVVTLTFYVDIGSGVKPGSYSFPVELSWLTSVSGAMTQDGTVAPPPIASSSASGFDLSVTQKNSTVVDGSSTSATFLLANNGAATIYSPTFALTVASPLVLTGVVSPAPSAEVAPGQNATFVATVASGPSGTPGIYSGNLAVSYTDSSGTTHTQSFPVSFTVEGTVTLILQDTSVSQTATGFTITGSILNEGSVAAYYASITGLLGINTATPVYLGEIDPNTPLPFSVTIPFAAPQTLGNGTSAQAGNSSAPQGNRTLATRTGNGLNFSRPGSNVTLGGGFPGFFNRTRTSGGTSATIALALSFKDTFGNTKSQAFSVPTTVKTASELSGGSPTGAQTVSSKSGELTYVAYGVVVVLAVAVVGGSVMLRRHRAKALGALPQEQRGDQSVI